MFVDYFELILRLIFLFTGKIIDLLILFMKNKKKKRVYVPFLVLTFITVGAYFRFPSTSVKHLTTKDVDDHRPPNSHLNLEDFLWNVAFFFILSPSSRSSTTWYCNDPEKSFGTGGFCQARWISEEFTWCTKLAGPLKIYTLLNEDKWHASMMDRTLCT